MKESPRTVIVKKMKTKLREAYLNLVGDYPIESICALMLKEELEEILDEELTEEDFYYIIKENAKVYKMFFFRYKPNHYGYLELGGNKIGEIGIEAKSTIINNVEYI